MNALILSCSTGGGHNAAGKAIKEELERRGHKVDMFDPYELAGEKLASKIGNFYIKMVQKVPKLFGLIYLLGELYRRLPVRSPLYYINMKMVKPMQEYLEKNHYDVILMPHVFPAEILTCMKAKGMKVPKMIFIATDYTCIPFTEETDCDCYIIPSKRLTGDFAARGIATAKLSACGIPVKRAFWEKKIREEALCRLNLPADKCYMLLAGGSVGAGKIRQTIDLLQRYLKQYPECVLIAICGNHESLYRKLQKKYDGHEQVILLQSTDYMADYMCISDVLISKPGGLTSTEAAVSGIPLIHISPIPGCENKNMHFFEKCGMSLAAKNDPERLTCNLERLRKEKLSEKMIEAQQREINPHAAEDICNLAESLAAENEIIQS